MYMNFNHCSFLFVRSISEEERDFGVFALSLPPLAKIWNTVSSHNVHKAIGTTNDPSFLCKTSF